jgi:F-type H+-transporting ATPase subunit delta
MANLKNIRVSARYATALFEIAVETKQLDVVHKDMMLVRQVVEDSRDLLLVFRSPLVNVDKKISVLNEIFQSKVSKLSLMFLTLITKKGRAICLDAITDSYHGMYMAFHNIKTVYVESASALEPAAKEKLKMILASHTGCIIDIVPQVKPDLIGGFRLKYDDFMYDLSIKRRFLLLRKEFERNIYEKKF